MISFLHLSGVFLSGRKSVSVPVKKVAKQKQAGTRRMQLKRRLSDGGSAVVARKES